MFFFVKIPFGLLSRIRPEQIDNSCILAEIMYSVILSKIIVIYVNEIQLHLALLFKVPFNEQLIPENTQGIT